MIMTPLPRRLLALLILVFQFTPALADDAPFVVVLGIAQDAGYPQANCYQPHCMRAWDNPEFKRLASSIAVIDPQGMRKYLFDATPDMREQLFRLHTIAPDPHFTLGGVFLTHGHIGHYAGLMHFGHEASGSKNVPVYAMPRMRSYLSSNGPWDQLVNFQNIRLFNLEDGENISLSDRLAVTPMLVPHRDEYTETVGFRIDGPNKSALFIPDIDKWDRWDTSIRDLVRSVDYALLDATFFADGELPGRDMSGIGHPFVSESMRLFADMTEDEKSRVIFIHLNHTNPLLIEGSAEREEVESRGFRIARPGMTLSL
jgi:pyrroloquinoline quinone biosynthesis protein B